MLKIGIVILVVGAILTTYSLQLSPFKDERTFQQRYSKLNSGQSEQFFKLYGEMSSPKFAMQDYGITLGLIGLLTILVSKWGGFFLTTPRRRFSLILLAICLPFISAASYVFDIYLGFYREQYPHWADSIAIPLSMVPIIAIELMIWVLLHLFFLKGGYHARIEIMRAFSTKVNWWLFTISMLTLALVAFTIVAGQYWYALIGILWFYFYLSLAANRVVNTQTDTFEPANLHITRV